MKKVLPASATARGAPKKSIKIVLSGGGTGGHITPLLAIAHELSGYELHYIGENSAQEQRLIAPGKIMTHRILAGKFRRYFGHSLLSHLTDIKTIALNIRDAVKFGVGLLQSLYLLLRIKPGVVFSKGGYVALPVGLAAVLLRIPVVTHDSDVVPGLTNKVLNRFAKARACGFPRPGSVFTGTPVRRAIVEAKPLDLGTKKPVVLFVGGSLGAERVNQAVFAALSRLGRKYHVLHIVGERGFGLAPPPTSDYQPYAFVDEQMGALLKTADVVVSRAGATAISELAALGKATVLIPGAHLTGGQQPKNAAVLAEVGAALVLPESRLRSQTLLRAIAEALQKKDQLEEAIRSFYQPAAAQKLAHLIVQSAKKDD